MSRAHQLTLVFIVVLLGLSGCETLLDSNASTKTPRAQASTEQQAKPKAKTRSVTECPEAEDVSHETFSPWLRTYLEARNLTDKELSELINQQANLFAKQADEETRLQLATLMTASETPEQWRKALLLLNHTWDNPDFQLLADWLRSQNQERQQQMKRASDIQSELQTLQATKAAMETELIELREKIQALTQIEHTIMEKVEP
ncbi:MAG: hypothetical protein IPM37_05955 [Hahellaceae bacterium]|nr:hypothetical protein [Hahellaceae bacterium]